MNFREFARAPVILLSTAKSAGTTTVKVLIEDKVYEYDVYDSAWLKKTIKLYTVWVIFEDIYKNQDRLEVLVAKGVDTSYPLGHF